MAASLSASSLSSLASLTVRTPFSINLLIRASADWACAVQPAPAMTASAVTLLQFLFFVCIGLVVLMLRYADKLEPPCYSQRAPLLHSCHVANPSTSPFFQLSFRKLGARMERLWRQFLSDRF